LNVLYSTFFLIDAAFVESNTIPNYLN